MTWRLDWHRHEERLASLERATLAVLRAQAVTADDPYGAIGRLLTEWRVVAKDLKVFRDSNASAIPAPALVQIEALAGEAILSGANISGIPGLSAYLAIFSAFRSRFAFQLTDAETRAVSATERAFVHLQQLIIVDESVQSRWSAAFEKNEVRCEALGAAHLLLHGIWSFKVDGAGARTDLVLQETTLNVHAIERAAEALVLTEWKKVADPRTAVRVATGARTQASLYASGVLSAIELRRHRYIVLVSKDRLPAIPDEESAGIVYRYINIAVSPSTPSKAT